MFLSCFIFWGRRSFFLLSVTFVRTKTTGVDFTLYPVLYEKEMAFICVLIILGDSGAACLHYEQSLFSSKIRGEERRTRAARSVGVGTAQSRSQSRSHTCFALVPQFSRKRETNRRLLLVGLMQYLRAKLSIDTRGETHR